MERIRGLESALRQRESSLQKLNMQLHSKDMQYLQLHAGPDAHSESLPPATRGRFPQNTAWRCLQAPFTVILTGLDYRKRISPVVIRSDVTVYAKTFGINNAIGRLAALVPVPSQPSLDPVWTQFGHSVSCSGSR